MTLSITGFVWASTEITVVVDGESRTIETQASQVDQALAEAAVPLDDADLVTPSRDSRVQGGMTIVVRHAVPVKLDLGGQSVEVAVVGESVADVLVAAGIDPALNPTVKPSLDAPIKEGMTVSVADTFLRVVQEEDTLAPRVRRQLDPSLKRGVKRVVTRGVSGRVLRVYRVLVTQGVETTRVLSAEKVLEPSVPSVVAVGTARRTAAGAFAGTIPPAPKRGRRVRTIATGYSAKQPDLDDWTATGAFARRGVIAVDPDFIPLGTHVYVPGYGYAVAADTGGAIDGNRIDLCFDTVAEANFWGRRTVTIIVLD